MKFELITQEYDPEQNEYYDWTPKQWDDEREMYIDSETGEPWCDHEWKSTWSPDTYSAKYCINCGERNY